jgi:hypothetical protein
VDSPVNPPAYAETSSDELYRALTPAGFMAHHAPSDHFSARSSAVESAVESGVSQSAYSEKSSDELNGALAPAAFTIQHGSVEEPSADSSAGESIPESASSDAARSETSTDELYRAPTPRASHPSVIPSVMEPVPTHTSVEQLPAGSNPNVLANWLTSGPDLKFAPIQLSPSQLSSTHRASTQFSSVHTTSHIIRHQSLRYKDDEAPPTPPSEQSKRQPAISETLSTAGEQEDPSPTTARLQYRLTRAARRRYDNQDASSSSASSSRPRHGQQPSSKSVGNASVALPHTENEVTCVFEGSPTRTGRVAHVQRPSLIMAHQSVESLQACVIPTRTSSLYHTSPSRRSQASPTRDAGNTSDTPTLSRIQDIHPLLRGRRATTASLPEPESVYSQSSGELVLPGERPLSPPVGVFVDIVDLVAYGGTGNRRSTPRRTVSLRSQEDVTPRPLRVVSRAVRESQESVGAAEAVVIPQGGLGGQERRMVVMALGRVIEQVERLEYEQAELRGRVAALEEMLLNHFSEHDGEQ